MRFFCNFYYISQRIKIKFDTGIRNWMLILIFGSESGLGTISDNMTQNHYFTSLFDQTPLRNSIAMVTPEVPGDQELFERVCYTYIEY